MNRIIGYFLSAVGLIMVFFSLISMFKVFTGAQVPVQVIKTFSLNLNTQYGPVAMDGAQYLVMINLALHAVFMFFILMAGARICNIGINFVKVDVFAEALGKNPAKELKKI